MAWKPRQLANVGLLMTYSSCMASSDGSSHAPPSATEQSPLPPSSTMS
jgi:hypothetical protein